jgi:hypothetical protein
MEYATGSVPPSNVQRVEDGKPHHMEILKNHYVHATSRG